MGLLSFFSTSSAKTVADSFAFLGADMHSHLLPEIDDGSQDVEDSVEFVRDLHDLGYQKFVCTPHIISDMYPNTRQTIDPAYQLLKSSLAAQQIPVTLEYAAEYMVNPEFEDLINEDQLLSFGDGYILIEMSYMAPSLNMKKVIFDLIMKGLKPILAHPERYHYYHNDYNGLMKLMECGCLLQTNILSLTGHYGKDVKKLAEKIIKDGKAAFAGTDLHHSRHLGLLQKLSGDKKMMSLLREVDWKNKTLLS